MDLDADIADYYALGGERNRLATWGRLEAERTRELMARFLPAPPAVVLDVGGAEGAHALPLARAGYRVHLTDPVAAHVQGARVASAGQPTAPLASAEVGDARALHAADGSVDAVLMFGPLYHLIEANDRAMALTEAHRVLRTGGLLLVAGISRFASTVNGLRAGVITDAAFEAIVLNDLSTGVHRNPDIQSRPAWFTLSYFHTPDELRAEVRNAGFPDADVYAVEGPSMPATIDTDLDDPAARAAILRAIERVEREPSLLGASPHLLAVATKP